MKKFFAMLLVLCMTMGLGALAEAPADPFAEEPVAVEVEAEPAASVPVSAEPEGEERYMAEGASVIDWGIATPVDVMLDEVHAKDATAEDATVIRSKPGCHALGIRVYYHPYNDQQGISDAFQAKLLIGDQALDCRRFLESAVPGSVEPNACAGLTLNMNAGDSTFNYLESAEDRPETFRYGDIYYRNMNEVYYMYDVIGQVPEDAVKSGTPIYLMLTMGERTFWYQVM